jgi:hypothetical protein
MAPPALTRQQIVGLLDTIPTFNVVDADSRIVGTRDEEGEECVRFWLDPDEVRSVVHVQPVILAPS